MSNMHSPAFVGAVLPINATSQQMRPKQTYRAGRWFLRSSRFIDGSVRDSVSSALRFGRALPLPGCGLDASRFSCSAAIEKTAAGESGPLTRLRDASESELSTFGDAVRGEFLGFEGSFDLDTGDPLDVPNFYIPEEFVEWQVCADGHLQMIPKGFECTNSVILRGTRLFDKHFRVLPCVSLFGDHVEAEEDLQITDVIEDDGLFVFGDGSFTAGRGTVTTTRDSLLDKWPSAKLVLRVGQKSLRVELKFDFAKAELVESMDVTVEAWDCVHCDGANMEGSSGYIEGWVSGERLEPGELEGNWAVTDPSGRSDTGPTQPRKHLYLPNGIDVAISEVGGGGRCLRVGWLVDASTRILLTRSYDANGVVIASERHIETKA